MKTMRVRLDFIDEILGTAAADPEIHRNYIASKAPDAQSIEQEVAAVGVDDVEEKAMTVFPRNHYGEPIFWNYQIKGFFKSACSALRAIDGTKSSKLKAYKKQIDLRIFVFPQAYDPSLREIIIHTEKPIGSCQRPLRAATAQGERIALANSEMIAPGAWCEFDIMMLNDSDEALVKEWLDYGRLNGLGQWRNSGKGAFVWKEITKES